jgi:hypothetical protein
MRLEIETRAQAAGRTNGQEAFPGEYPGRRLRIDRRDGAELDEFPQLFHRRPGQLDEFMDRELALVRQPLGIRMFSFHWPAPFQGVRVD